MINTMRLLRISLALLAVEIAVALLLVACATASPHNQQPPEQTLLEARDADLLDREAQRLYVEYGVTSVEWGGAVYIYREVPPEWLTAYTE